VPLLRQSNAASVLPYLYLLKWWDPEAFTDAVSKLAMSSGELGLILGAIGPDGELCKGLLSDEEKSLASKSELLLILERTLLAFQQAGQTSEAVQLLFVSAHYSGSDRVSPCVLGRDIMGLPAMSLRSTLSLPCA
jgi:hypothetical protein